MMLRPIVTCAVVLILVAGALRPTAEAQRSTAAAEDWQRVDVLRPGTKIVVTLKSGENRIGVFRQATNADLTIQGDQGSGETLQKSLIATVVTYDPVRDGAMKGALVGAGAFLAWLQISVKSCGTGCENDLPGAIAIPVGALGAGVGSMIGLLADLDAGGSVVLFPAGPADGQSPVRTSRFFPVSPAVRIGPVYGQTVIHSPMVKGKAAAPGFALVVRLSPHVSIRVEHTATGGRFHAAPGSVPDTVLQNVVPATSRFAGLSRGIESRHVSYLFSELVGIHPRPWGRLRLEFLAGLGVQGQEDRDYYDAYRDEGQGTMNNPTRTERIPGKYYVLNFQSPKTGLVLGLDVEVALIRNFTVAPMLRYNHIGDPRPSIVYGIGAHWHF